MNIKQLDTKLKEMVDGEFMTKSDIVFLNLQLNDFINTINNYFGYNDGEPLDEIGIKFVLEYMKFKWYIENGVVDND